jgi:TRAP-type C4-dicarboxylate transport system permease small subunit
MRDIILRIDRWTTGASLFVACALLCVVSALGIWQVISRFALQQPSTWTEEVLRRLLIWAVMLGTVAAFRHGALISVDLMLRSARGTWLRVVRSIITFTSLSFLGVIVWFGVDLTWRVRFQTFSSMDLSIAWAYAALPVGAALAIIAVLAHHISPPPPTVHSALEAQT